MIELAMAVRFSSGSYFRSSSASQHYRPIWSSDELGNIQVTSCRVTRSGCFDIARLASIDAKLIGPRFSYQSRLQRFNGDLFSRRYIRKNRTQATAEHLGSASDSTKQNGRSRYHPSEEIAESTLENVGDAKLTPAEATRTIVEVNSKATLMLTGVISDGFLENIVWPDVPYVTDEHGNVYFHVKNNEDIMQTITSDSNYVQVIIGFDTMEMIKEMELSGPSEIDFGIEELDDDDTDVEDEDEGDEDDDDDDDEEDWVAVLDEDDGGDSDEALGDWAKLDTMRSSHPMYFAKRLSEVASDDPVDWMEHPSAGLAIQGLLRPALMEESSNIQRHLSSHKSPYMDEDKPGNADLKKPEDLALSADEQKPHPSDDSSIWVEDRDKEGIPRNGISFYKLEMITIQLITAQGNQTNVEVEDFSRARVDTVAHAAANIITRLNDGGAKTTEALKSLCLRLKGVQAEEVKIVGIDSLGFDLRICSGTQIQTLRVAFKTQATSEYSAERQLNDMLFPRIHTKPQRQRHSHQKES